MLVPLFHFNDVSTPVNKCKHSLTLEPVVQPNSICKLSSNTGRGAEEMLAFGGGE
jgi:hypothetical protein